MAIAARIVITGLGVIQTRGPIDYDDVARFVQEIQTNWSGCSRLRTYRDLVHHKYRIERFLPLLQTTPRPPAPLELALLSTADRYVVYKLCEILGLRFERMEQHGTRTFKCTEFDGPDYHRNEEDSDCGCAFVPKHWRKYEGDLDYDDRVREYKVPWCYKLGVRVFFSA